MHNRVIMSILFIARLIFTQRHFHRCAANGNACHSVYLCVDTVRTANVRALLVLQEKLMSLTRATNSNEHVCAESLLLAS